MTPLQHGMTTDNLGTLVRTALASVDDFRPFAVFDESLDCIRVITRDCSVNEIRVNELLTLLEANYPIRDGFDCVGFTIKGVAYLCQEHGISQDAPWKLADFLDAIVSVSPVVRATVMTTVQPIVQQSHIQDVERMAA